MAEFIKIPASAADDPIDATLVFHEQADGRKVSRLPGGKVVLIDLTQADRVRDVETWFVKLRHRDTFAIADPVEKVTAATLEGSGVALTSPLADSLRRARTVERHLVPAVPAAPGATPQCDPAVPAQVEPPLPASPVAATGARVGAALEVSRLLRASDRVALFIDGANTDGSARAAGYFVDFKKAREFADFTASDSHQLRFFDFVYLEDHRDELARPDRVREA